MYIPQIGNGVVENGIEGTCDVLVVEGEDKTLTSTTFIVKFNRSILRERGVRILVNNKLTDVRMQVNSAYEGYFESFAANAPADAKRLKIETSRCASMWQEVGEGDRAAVFDAHRVEQSDASDVNKNVLMYRIGEEYFKEEEVLKKIVQQQQQRSVKREEEEKKMIITRRGEDEMLKMLMLRDGENKLEFEYEVGGGVQERMEMRVYKYKQHDMLIVSDIDGTITKSDVLGYVLPYVGMNWHHKDLVQIYNVLVQRGYRMVYLTARSFTEYKTTRRYLDDVMSGEHKLPRGPVLLYPSTFMGGLRQELVKKTQHVYKSNMLRDVQRAFASTSCIAAGFGNQQSDAVAYRQVGVHDNFNFVIKDSIIHMLSGLYKFTLESFYANLNMLFPSLK